MIRNKYGEAQPWLSLTSGIVVPTAGMVVLNTLLSMVFGGYAAEVTETGSSGSLFLRAGVIYFAYFIQITLVFVCFRYFFRRPLIEMGFYSRGAGGQMLLGLAFGGACIAAATFVLVIGGYAGVTDIDAGYALSLPFWLGLGEFILVGFFEEILCRGYMMSALKVTRNRVLILAVPALLFGLMHIFNPNLTAFSMVNIVLVGLLFGYLFIKSGRLWAPIGYHIAWNFVQGHVLGIAVSGGASSGIFTIEFTGPDWLTGGAFGVEGGAVCTIIILLGFFFTRHCVKTPKDEPIWTPDGGLPMPFYTGRYLR